MSPMQRLGVASLAPACMPWAPGIAALPASSLLVPQSASWLFLPPSPLRSHRSGSHVWTAFGLATRRSGAVGHRVSCGLDVSYSGLEAPCAGSTSMAPVASCMVGMRRAPQRLGQSPGAPSARS